MDCLTHRDDLICPVIITEGKSCKRQLSPWRGHVSVTLDLLEEHLTMLLGYGLRNILLLGIPASRDPTGSRSLRDDILVPAAIQYIRERALELHIISDINICQYTTHGHCGIIVNNTIDNDASIEIFLKQAQLHIAAGVDELMPSAMCDGLVYNLKTLLSELKRTQIRVMSQAAKFASSLYGPAQREFFAENILAGGHLSKASYQLDPASPRHALRKVLSEQAEGADSLVLKPTLGYLDLLPVLRNNCSIPVSTFITSGEHMLLA
ncbi:MAG: hypothetical protein KDD42_07980, partial [Bdellovibrionales bacterium]|nr:hypothetical protein [Bdellovibrionales bacterium]